MKSYFLSLGSNIKPEYHMPQCVELLEEQFGSIQVSSFYETDPVGPAGKDFFWNAVAHIKSGQAREALSDKLKQIEEELGRVRNVEDKFIARTIDIDILPQENYQKQGFIIIPLAEIASDIEDEESGLTFGELASQLSDEDKAGCRKIQM